jgi:hypothetical protein
MKDQTNNYIIFVLTLLFAFAACGCVDSVDTDPKNLIGRWQMSKVIHQGKTILKPDRQKWQSEVEIEFLDDGKIEGTLPNDTFTGDYKTTDDDSIAFNCWADTKRGENDWGYSFYNNIRFVKRFSLRKNGINFKYRELYLNYGNGELILKN